MPLESQCEICDRNPSILDEFKENDICLGCYFKYLDKIPNYIPDKQSTKWMIQYAKRIN